MKLAAVREEHEPEEGASRGDERELTGAARGRRRNVVVVIKSRGCCRIIPHIDPSRGVARARERRERLHQAAHAVQLSLRGTKRRERSRRGPEGAERAGELGVVRLAIAIARRRRRLIDPPGERRGEHDAALGVFLLLSLLPDPRRHIGPAEPGLPPHHTGEGARLPPPSRPNAQ